jgi:hypothetical protein
LDFKPEGSPEIRGSTNVFLRPLLGFTKLGHQRNSVIIERLKDTNIVEEIQGYQQKWRNHWKGWKETTFSNWHSVNQPKG